FLRGCENVYVSIDIDVIDPAYAPGVANPEPEGLSPTYLLNLLSEVINESVWGFDIVEVVPPIDPSGITSVLAAKIINELASYIYIAKGKGGELVRQL
ncbi:MAG TPA: agmatinase, partial [Acidilobales archaeon]|nr:agmatinase [Acidilobales archaeon]